MIYLITGVPGSGKSLYAVAELLQKLMREKIKKPDGGEIERRLCVDGIPDLLLPHELMAPRAEASILETAKDKPAQSEGNGLFNWWTWVKPGDVVVCDEVQRHWRPRGMGTRPPEEIAKLEVHRHFGVDFVLITQNAMLLDQNVRRLVGRHMHVRRLFGTGRALIYDWDGCQTDTTRTSGATKKVWGYPRSAFKLYKSSELHTKQHQKIPLFLAFPLVVLALGAFAGPKAYDAMHRSMTGKPVTSASAPVPVASAAKAQGAPVQAAAPPTPAPGTPQPQPSGEVVASAPPRVLGCIVFRERCECFGESGALVEVGPERCQEGSHRVGTVVPLAAGPIAPPRPQSAPAGGMGASPHAGPVPPDMPGSAGAGDARRGGSVEEGSFSLPTPVHGSSANPEQASRVRLVGQTPASAAL